MLPKDFFIFFPADVWHGWSLYQFKGRRSSYYQETFVFFKPRKVVNECHGGRESGENAEKLLDLLQPHNTPDQRGGRQASADSSLSESLEVSPASTCSLLTLQQHCCSLSCLSCLTTCSSSSSSPLGSRPVLARCLGASRCLWVLAR